MTAGKLGTIARGGQRQVTYNGHPLYTYVGDATPGDATGQGLDQFGAEWYVLNGPATRSTTTDRHALPSATRRPLAGAPYPVPRCRRAADDRADHLDEYTVGHYDAIPTIGTLFVLNCAPATLVAVALAAPGGRLGRTVLDALALGGIGIAAGSLVALLISERTTLFGFSGPLAPRLARPSAARPPPITTVSIRTSCGCIGCP